MSNWDKRWMDMCTLVASWSKDRSRQVGAVIVDNRGVAIASGWNGFPRGIDDTVESRHQRPEKYLWTEHSERNAIYNAAAKGVSTLGCTMYLQWYPCADCARAIIQCGIISVVCVEPDWNDPTYKHDFDVVRQMFDECNINVRFIEGMEAPIRNESTT
jgi:dCMP deaminase